MHLLELQGLCKVFDKNQAPAVLNLSLRVEPGEIFGLLGPSGCGKTTTLRMIAGFTLPDKGNIFLQGKDITSLAPEKRGIGLVFQDYALFPHLSVKDNVIFGLRSLPKYEKQSRAQELLDLVGMRDQGNKMPDELSGGQQQRVAIARALGAKPAILLLDEPFSNLDAALRESTRTEIRSILKKAKISAVLVTHDQEEALSFCDRLAVMNGGQIEQIGCPEKVYQYPQSAFVAQFLGRANILQAQAQGKTAQTVLGPLSLAEEAQGKVLLSLRPEHLTLETDPLGRAQVVSKDFRGHDLTYRVMQDGLEYIVHTEYTKSFEAGEKVKILCREPAVVLHSVSLCGLCELKEMVSQEEVQHCS